MPLLIPSKYVYKKSECGKHWPACPKERHGIYPGSTLPVLTLLLFSSFPSLAYIAQHRTPESHCIQAHSLSFRNRLIATKESSHQQILTILWQTSFIRCHVLNQESLLKGLSLESLYPPLGMFCFLWLFEKFLSVSHLLMSTSFFLTITPKSALK